MRIMDLSNKSRMIINKIYKFIKFPRILIFYILDKLNIVLSDKILLLFMYKLRIGMHLSLRNPQTFNEKLQWLKLYDRRPEYTTYVDKYAVREFIAKTIGEEYLIPLLGVWNSPDEIDFDKLPNQFVLKCNHDSGGLVICKDKSKLNIEETKAKLNKSLKRDYYLSKREWSYKNVPRKIIAEKYIVDESGCGLRDYKFYCFNGVPKYCQVISDRFTNETIDFFDMDWNHQEFTGLALPHKPFSNSPIPIPIPINFTLMKEIATKLSKDIPFVRIDLYEINGKVYFGEITFYPASGFGVFTPDKWNYELGRLIKLPDNKRICKL